MPWFLGGNFSLFTMSANIARPGTSGIYMHRDQMVMTPDTTAHAYVLNSMWYLTDVSDEKGATRVYPGSHLLNVLPTRINHVVRLGFFSSFFFWFFFSVALSLG